MRIMQYKSSKDGNLKLLCSSYNRVTYLDGFEAQGLETYS